MFTEDQVLTILIDCLFDAKRCFVEIKNSIDSGACLFSGTTATAKAGRETGGDGKTNVIPFTITPMVLKRLRAHLHASRINVFI